jgi:hypothetical protein
MFQVHICPVFVIAAAHLSAQRSQAARAHRLPPLRRCNGFLCPRYLGISASAPPLSKVSWRRNWRVALPAHWWRLTPAVGHPYTRLSRSNSFTAPHRYFYVPPSPAAARHRPCKSLDLAADDDAALPTLNGRRGSLPTPPVRKGSGGSSPDGGADDVPRRMQHVDALPSVLAGDVDPAAAALAATPRRTRGRGRPRRSACSSPPRSACAAANPGLAFRRPRGARRFRRASRTQFRLSFAARTSPGAILRLDEDDLAQYVLHSSTCRVRGPG